MADVKISQLPAATLPVAGTEVLPIVQSSITAKVSISNILSAPNPGNVSFSGTGNRITGDFSNATVANRVMFQTSTVNGNTALSLIPNGTGVVSSLDIYNAADPANASTIIISPNATESRFIASRTGTGTFLPMTFYTGGSERVRIDTSGNVGIGTSSPARRLDVLQDAQYQFRIGTAAGNSYDIGRSPVDGLLHFYGNQNGFTGYVFGGVNGERMRIDSSGIVTMSAYGAGAATFSAAGVISSVSDETWKTKDGVPVNPDAMLKKLEPGYWFYNDEKKDIFGADRQLGFYAQNVNAAIGPEAAPEPEEGKPWGYYDRSVLAVVVMSLQKALSTIESLETRLAALEQK